MHDHPGLAIDGNFRPRFDVHYSYEKFVTELGQKLRSLRKERGWTLRDMIVLHGFHVSHWQKFEKGKFMSVPSLLRICEIFQVSLESLIADLGRIEAPNQSPASVAESPVVPLKKERKSTKPLSSSGEQTLPSPLARSPRHKP